MTHSLRFGILPLDRLIDPNTPSGGLRLDSGETATVAIVGPDGAGKSILALHLASHYRATRGGGPRVVYVSTDLSHSRAEKTWNTFGLDKPGHRTTIVPDWVALRDSALGSQVDLERRPPHDEQLLQNLMESDSPTSVSFLDLESQTTGDDWLFLHRFLAALPAATESTPKHLVIVDAVEGLETFSGERDSFGEHRGRRARIAQLIRLAKEKCHLVLVVEEPKAGERLPEEFVADLVVRLRMRTNDDYSRRTIDIEKARGQHHVRGEHDIAIRSGRGSRTGSATNVDDPLCLLAYVDVFWSLHARTRAAADREGSEPKIQPLPNHWCGFGIPYLDRLVGKEDRSAAPHSDRIGLPAGTTSALIGDDGTHKSRVGRAFLSQATRSDASLPHDGLALLITTQAIDHDELCAKINEHRLLAGQLPLAPRERERVLCRRLPIHHLSSAGLMHIIERNIRQAVNVVRDAPPPENPDERRKRNWRIRVVIDDWSTIQSTNPEAAADPLLLPHLLYMLKREGVTVLILDTQPGSPSRALEREIDRDLRALIQHHLYTWHVPFYGERRVAITAIPPIVDDLPVVVYELRPARESPGDPRLRHLHPEGLTVDPHFEMYSGLEEGQPARIPLKVRLYVGDRDPTADDPSTPPRNTYLERTKDLFSRLFQQADGSATVEFEDAAGYEQIRDFANMQDGSQLDYTLVFQVDEFWADRRGQLYPLDDYLLAPTLPEPPISTRDTERVEIEDPFHIFDDKSNVCKHRARVFQAPGYGFNEQNHPPFDKCPFLWDFGFLLVRTDIWLKPENQKRKLEGLSNPDATEASTIGEIFERLNCSDPATAGLPYRHVRWLTFLAACRMLSARGDDRVFDVDLRTAEAMSCLVLEVWLSFIFEEVSKRNVPDELASLFKVCRSRYETTATGGQLKSDYGPTLITLIDKYRAALYRALWLLRHFVDHVRIGNGWFVANRADPKAIAARHWYSTASDAGYRRQRLTPLRLPGHFSTRGDWFLAMTRGSRSPRLGMRAMDLLNSRRANNVRLAEGLGLPVRELTSGKDDGMETCLRRHHANGSSTRIQLGDLKNMGAPPSFDENGRFFWIWRSMIDQYESHSRLFNHWLAWCFREAETFFPRRRDIFIDVDQNDLRKEPTYVDQFSKACEMLHSLLTSADGAALR